MRAKDCMVPRKSPPKICRITNVVSFFTLYTSCSRLKKDVRRNGVKSEGRVGKARPKKRVGQIICFSCTWKLKV